jgi:hypothetical protein
MTNENEKNRSIEKTEKISAFSALRKSIELIARKPVLVVPIILGVIVAGTPYYIVSLIRGIPDIFEWWWFADLSQFSAGDVLLSLILTAIGAILMILAIFVCLDMAKNAYLNLELSIKKSVNKVFTHPVHFVVAAIVAQVLLLTGILIPLGLLVFAITAAELDNIRAILLKAIRFLRSSLIDMAVLAIIWLGARFVLTLIEVEGIFILSFIPDTIVEVAVVCLYLSKKAS